MSDIEAVEEAFLVCSIGRTSIPIFVQKEPLASEDATVVAKIQYMMPVFLDRADAEYMAALSGDADVWRLTRYGSAWVLER